MATIGTFTRDKAGYTGAIRTLTVNIKARIVPNDARKSESAPDTSGFSPGPPGRPSPLGSLGSHVL